MQRILVCGSRDYTSNHIMYDILDDLLEDYRFRILIHGNAPGADTMAKEWANSRAIDVLGYAADWKTHGRAAGPLRNRKMLQAGRPNLVVVFVTKPLTNSRGTFDMVSIAKKAGLPIIINQTLRIQHG